MNKQEFTVKAKHRIDEVSDRIEVLMLKAKTASAALKLKYHQQINELQEKKTLLKAKHEEVKTMTDEKWDNLKDSLKIDFSYLNEELKHMLD